MYITNPLPMMTAYKKYGWNIKDFPNAYHYFEEEITLTFTYEIDR